MEESQIERIIDRLDDIQKDQRDLLVRMGKVETMIHERTDDTREIRNMLKIHAERIADLERHKSSTIGAREIIAFSIMAGVAIWGVLK